MSEFIKLGARYLNLDAVSGVASSEERSYPAGSMVSVLTVLGLDGTTLFQLREPADIGKVLAAMDQRCGAAHDEARVAAHDVVAALRQAVKRLEWCAAGASNSDRSWIDADIAAARAVLARLDATPEVMEGDAT